MDERTSKKKVVWLQHGSARIFFNPQCSSRHETFHILAVNFESVVKMPECSGKFSGFEVFDPNGYATGAKKARQMAMIYSNSGNFRC